MISTNATAAGFVALSPIVAAKADSNCLRQQTAAEQHADEARIGSTIGHFLIESVIASGGMGTVFKAVQLEPVRRQVALKMIKWGFADTNAVTRFHAERQALALMDHADIAKVYEADSTATGQPYFAMEYCEGEPIDRYCDSQKLDVRQRIGLIIKLARAVNRAHSHGVVHRDLKPSNVLVANDQGRSILKVIDFGIAKFIDNQFHAGDYQATRTGEMVGTPAYMSPEQAAADEIDGRTDVFAIGAILFKLLTGSTPLGAPPLKTQSLAQLVAHFQSYQPTTPSQRFLTLDATAQQQVLRSFQFQKRKQWLASVKGDLDWIVLRAIESERTRRYANPSDLADDLERFLCNKPTQAAAPTLRYRAKKFYLRNKSTVISSAIAMVVILLASSFAAASWWRLKVEERAERLRTRNEVELLLNEADDARVQATKGGPGWRMEFSNAANTLSRIDAVLENAPNLDKFTDRITQLRNKIRNDEAAVAFGNLLDDARERSIQIDAVKADDESGLDSGLERFRRAFREFGVEPTAVSPSQAACVLRECPQAVLDKVIESLEFLIHEDRLGVGISLREQTGIITVADFCDMTGIEDSTKSRVDIRSGDRVLMINHVNMLESASSADLLAAALRQLFGKPGQKVNLAFVRGTDQPFQCELECGGATAHWAAEVLAYLDPDPWRMELRDAVLSGDLETLSRLADSEHIPRRSPASLIQLAGARLKLAPSNASIKFLEEAQQHHAQSYWLNHYLGTALATTYDPPMPDQALRYLTAAVSLRPASIGARVNLAECLTRAGKEQQALMQTRIAFEFAPEVGSSPKYSTSLTNESTTEAMRETSKQIPKLKVVDAWEHRAREIARNGDRDEALRIVNLAASDSPDANIPRMKGAVFIELGDYVAARIVLSDAVEVTPDDAATRFYYGIALQCLGDMPAALREYEAALAIEPDNETIREFRDGVAQVSNL